MQTHALIRGARPNNTRIDESAAAKCSNSTLIHFTLGENTIKH